MKILSHFPRNINPPALIVGCLIVFVAMTISEMIKQGQTDRTRNLVETYADELSARIEEQLKTRIAIVSLIRDYWQSDVVVSPKHFKTITEAATTSFNDVQALNWVNTDGVIIAVTPLEGNEDALTLDINDFEQPARALELSRTTNSLQITPPIRLAQGGNGFVGYAPVVKGTTLMGYISIVFRSDVLLNEIRQGRNDFTLRIEDDGKLLYGQELFEFSDLATARSINVVGRTWDVKVEPNETIVKEAQSIIDELIIIISFIVSMGMVLALNQAHQNRQKLKEREERFSLAIEGTSDGLFDVNVETGSVYYSPRWFRLLGYEPGELPVNAREFYNRIHPDDVAHVPTLEQLSKLDTTQNDTEFRMRHKNGTWIHILSRAKLINKNGKIIRMVGTHVDVTDLRKEQEKLKIAAITDPLTGLRNRAGIEDHLAQISKTLNKNENICVLHIDLDGFKSINDRYGYEYGDKTLKIVAERLNEFFADLGLVARIGGDEFLTIWATAPSEIDISKFLDSLLRKIEEPIWYRNHKIHPSACLGISLYSRDSGLSLKELAPNAAIAVKDAKSKGSGKYSFYRRSMREAAIKNAQMAADIRNALENEEFKAFLQPQFNLSNSKITGFEALVRWQKSDGTIVPAKDFIPVADQFYLVDQIDEQMFVQVCKAIKILDKAGLADATISVNISTARLMSPCLAEHISKIIQCENVSPYRLRIELLESTLLDDISSVAENNIKNLARLGLPIDLDDFGTGYSAISSLRKYPISRVKIDRSFAKNVDQDQNLQVLAKAIVNLLKSLNLITLIEGVENERELDFFRQVGCDEAQGFQLGEPVAIEHVEVLFSRTAAK